ncbi:ATP-binding protein [Flavobacterium sp. N1994]|uniref:tetratricopeptide repeat-containing sensor histidine kinase n=1 Tax=Flavobacterium sp. N1994 TaxID=2986827 RepID=UPI0022212E9F|nr:ATP-binding protein [Flavobacterium sp. N1994]
MKNKKSIKSWLILLCCISQFGFAQKTQTPEHKKVFKILKNLDDTFTKDETKALKTLDSLNPILQKKSEYSLLGFSRRIASDIYLNQLDKTKALTAIDQSIAYYKKDNNNRGTVLSTLNKGNIYFLKGDLKIAMQIYTGGMELAQKNGLEYEAATLGKNIGLVFFNQEKIDVALQWYTKSLNVFLKLNKKQDVADTYTNIGNCYYEKYDSKNTISNYTKALSYVGTDTITLAKLYNNIGAVYVEDEKDTLKGLGYLLHALDLKVKINDQNNIIFQYENIATLYVDMKQYDKAESYLKKGFALAIKAESKEELKEIYEIYSLIYAGRKDYKKAYDYHKLFMKAKDTLLNIENLKAVEEIKTKYETAKKEKLLLQKEIQIKNTRNQLLMVSSVALFIGLIGFLVYRQQKLKNKQQEQEYQLKSAIDKIETQNKLQEQRLQISRDLHDNIGSQLTFIISSVDNIKYAFELQNSKLDAKLSSISNFAKSTIIELRDTIWAMNNSEITFEDLQSRIHNFVEKAKEAKQSIIFTFTIEESLKDSKFTSIEGMNIYRTIQEAVNNSIKYAEAQNINIAIQHQDNDIVIVISDDGKGFEDKEVELGNGINNMKKRIADCNGTLNIKTSSNEGTEITIRFPNKIS